MWLNPHYRCFLSARFCKFLALPKNRVADLTMSIKTQPNLSLAPCAVVQASATPILEEVRVDMADMKVERRPISLVTNVGSCIALCMYDSVNLCGGMAHIMLPNSNNPKNEAFPYKYADTAVPALAEALRRLGNGKVCLSAKIAGGANMFSNLKCRLLNIGERNAQAVKEALMSHGISLRAEDVGKNYGRRVSFNVVTGMMTVRSVDGVEKIL